MLRIFRGQENYPRGDMTVTKRILTMALALAMLIALIPAGAVAASAASAFTCSDGFIEVVKIW